MAKEKVKKVGRPAQNEGLKAWKSKRYQNSLNAIRYAMRHLMNDDQTEEEIKANLMEMYGYAQATAEQTITAGKRAAKLWEVHDTEKIRTRNLARLDVITEKAMEEGDVANAIRAIDIQNKTASLYVEKQVNVIGDNIRFEFGGGEGE